MSDGRVPVRVITGFLGSGKTTLLNFILKADHGLGRVGVIENEVGEVGIDGSVILADRKFDDRNIIELSNGCLCCTVRGDLKRAVLDMVARTPPIDSIVVETTGVAEPGPVVQTFVGDSDVAAKCFLKAIVTVVDAKHLDQHLSTDCQVASQIGFADLILINKIDLISRSSAEATKQVLQGMNPSADVVFTEKCDVSLEKVFKATWFQDRKPAELLAGPDNKPHATTHGVGSVAVTVGHLMSLPAVELWLSKLVSERGADFYRYKGVMEIKGAEGKKYCFQGVHQVFGGEVVGDWDPAESRGCVMVFIGVNLDRAELVEGLSRCTAPESLRFSLGDRVMCSTPAGWQCGRVVDTWFEGCPYRIEIDSGFPHIPGRKVAAPLDTETFVRAPVSEERC